MLGTHVLRSAASIGRTLRFIGSLRLTIIALFLLLAFVSISPVYAGTSASGTISEEETWSALDSPFQVTGNVVVSSGVTLTIEPSVTVKFDSGKALQIRGELVAQGTSVSPITFTSSASSPAAGDWVRLLFLSSATGASLDGSDNYVSGSILEHL